MHEIIKTLEEACEWAHEELKELMKKLNSANTVNPSDVQMFDYLTHSIKSIKTTIAMVEGKEKEEMRGYSGNMGMNSGYSGTSWYVEPVMNPNMYSGYSGARNQGGNQGGNYSGNYPMMNYSGRRGYSGDGEKQDATRVLEGMMRTASNDQQAMAIREAIEAVNRIR